MSSREFLREELAFDIAAFEAQGGHIERLPPGTGSGKAFPFNPTALAADLEDFNDCIKGANEA